MVILILMNDKALAQAIVKYLTTTTDKHRIKYLASG